MPCAEAYKKASYPAGNQTPRGSVRDRTTWLVAAGITAPLGKPEIRIPMKPGHNYPCPYAVARSTSAAAWPPQQPRRPSHPKSRRGAAYGAPLTAFRPRWLASSRTCTDSTLSTRRGKSSCCGKKRNSTRVAAHTVFAILEACAVFHPADSQDRRHRAAQAHGARVGSVCPRAGARTAGDMGC